MFKIIGIILTFSILFGLSFTVIYSVWVKYQEGARCPECRSWFSMVHSSFWIGGWNNLCKQATSRAGNRCYDCGKMVWDKTDEEYKKSLPEWCEAYCD